jgi:hypothetical protein
VYVKGQYRNEFLTKLTAGDHPLKPAGSIYSLAPDSMFVRAKSRHLITEAGLGNLINHFGKLVEATERGERRQGTLTYLGPVSRAEFATAPEGVEQTIPPGADPLLPRGGRRLWFFDTKERLPLLAITHDDKGQEVEYYRYDQFQSCGPLSDDAFNPDQLWGGPRR